MVKTYLAKLIEDAIKIHQDLSFGNLCYVIHGLASIISDSGILIGEACQDRGNNFGKVSGQFLSETSESDR